MSLHCASLARVRTVAPIGASGAFTQFTLSCWIKFNTITGTAVYILKGTDTKPLWMFLNYTTSQLTVQATGNTGTVSLTVTMPSADVWHHYCIRILSGTLSIWIDGALAGSVVKSDVFENTFEDLGVSAAGLICNYYDWGFWTTALTDANVLLLAGGTHPSAITPAPAKTAPLDSPTTGNVVNTDAGLNGTFALSNATPTWDADFPVFNAPPDAPSDLAVGVITSSSIDLSWTDNADDETGFTLQYDVVSTFDSPVTVDIPTGDTETDTVISLAADTEYFFRVRSYNASGDSDWATALSDGVTQYVSATTLTAPADFNSFFFI